MFAVWSVRGWRSKSLIPFTKKKSPDSETTLYCINYTWMASAAPKCQQPSVIGQKCKSLGHFETTVFCNHTLFCQIQLVLDSLEENLANVNCLRLNRISLMGGGPEETAEHLIVQCLETHLRPLQCEQGPTNTSFYSNWQYLSIQHYI